MADVASEVRSRVNAINQAWLSERFADLEPFFHPEVVLVHPRFEQRTLGRDALIASYADFAAKAQIEAFTTGETQVDAIAASAVATTFWKMKYRYESAVYDESGWDVLLFNRHDDAWIVVWRTVVLDAQTEAAS